MKMIKTILTSTAILLASVPAAFAGPTLAWSYKTIGYGQFACIQKAETKLYQMSASNVNRNNNINIFGDYPNTTIGISCRSNGEVVVTVAGNDAYLLRDEILNYF